MPIEFQIPTLRIQATEKLNEIQSEQVRKETLLLLEEGNVSIRAQAEANEGIRKSPSMENQNSIRNRKASTSISYQDGVYARQTSVYMDRTSVDCQQKNGMYKLGDLSGEILPKWVNGFRLKPFYGDMPDNPFKELGET